MYLCRVTGEFPSEPQLVDRAVERIDPRFGIMITSPSSQSPAIGSGSDAQPQPQSEPTSASAASAVACGRDASPNRSRSRSPPAPVLSADGTYVLPTKSKACVTEFRRVAYVRDGNYSIVECRPRTGRTHQIRVHLQYLGALPFLVFLSSFLKFL